MNGYFVLVLIVGPILAGGPPLLAIWLCERHANRYAAAVRKQHAQPIPAQTRPRQKALVR
ncbi:hypothetical protein [Micromonospora sp. DT47]|uniref:hypothetical protein n=1 Tax=Micromonospora sp. DT47 TaxID=3393431 RepID=UPI003CF7A2CD